jgi:hypothetical protein
MWGAQIIFVNAWLVIAGQVAAIIADIRYVEEAEPNRQALLEIYVAVALDTPFNDFKNH